MDHGTYHPKPMFQLSGFAVGFGYEGWCCAAEFPGLIIYLI